MSFDAVELMDNIFDALKSWLASERAGQHCPEWEDLYKNGLSALQKNEPDAAIPDFLLALELNPGYIECRRALRQAAKSAARPAKGFGRWLFRKVALSFLLSRVQLLVRFNPNKAISLAERALLKDPANRTAHKLLIEAALNLQLTSTALLSLEELPENRRLELKLARTLMANGNLSDAAAIYGRLLKENPYDTRVLRGIRAQSKYHREHPELTTAHPNRAETPTLVPAGDPEQIAESDEHLIARYEHLQSHCPKNIRVLMTLADAYARTNRFDEALNYYERTLAIPGADAHRIGTSIAAVKLKKYEAAIAHLDRNQPDYEAQRNRLEGKCAEIRQFRG